MSIICTDNSKNQEKSHKTGLKIRGGLTSESEEVLQNKKPDLLSSLYWQIFLSYQSGELACL